MLINFSELCEKYSFIPSGIIHIGAHLLEERDSYLAKDVKNIIWIEANPKVYSDISSMSISESEIIFNYAISDKDNDVLDLYVTNNTQSSSILELGVHKTHHPDIHVTEVLKAESKRIDTLISENNISPENYNFVNLDIQGAELLAIKGFGEILNNIKYIYTEVNTASVYKDCALVGELDEYLSRYGFSRVETKMTPFEWGDAFYIK